MSVVLFNVHVSYYYIGFTLFIHLIGTFCQECHLRSLRVDPDHINARLHGYTFITFENVGANACFDKCIRRRRCLSFNYKEEERHCEINEKNVETDLVEGIGYVHVNIQQYRNFSRYDPCSKIGNCQVGEICQTMRDGETFCVKDINQMQPVTDCSGLHPDLPSGTYEIRPNHFHVLKVYCDQNTSGGGWTVLQRRRDGSTDFYRGWTDYENGFGDLQNEFWLGNKNIHAITSQRQYQLRFDLEDFEEENRYAIYSTFNIGNASSEYQLTIQGYTGDAGNAMRDHEASSLNGKKFTTKDRDNDFYHSNCAISRHGAWWFRSCTYSHMNGLYRTDAAEVESTIHWYTWHNRRALKRTEMKVKPIL
ncbi:fibrinogen-like protein 1 [Mytilus californianus]|uniref:fibrinogen-like protein 1 n=1 Tax=Mytilus californianus TaxID=6549 RepID=UPI00224648AB|nr:fibrinogen-like protein 1 [Mytilus californianus]